MSYEPANVPRYGRTLESQATSKRRFSSQNSSPSQNSSLLHQSLNKPPSKEESLRNRIPRAIDLSYNPQYAPSWRRESLLQKLNKSLTHCPTPTSQQTTSNGLVNIPKHMLQMSNLEQPQQYYVEKNYFFQLIRKIPSQRLQRTEENLSEFITELPKMNFFFKPFSFVYCCSLFKLGKTRFYDSEEVIYQKGQDSQEFYIILWGKIKLVDKKESFKKISRKGETLSEETLFTTIRTKTEKAVALEECYLLQIDLKLYSKFSETIISNGLKNEIHLMEKNIKRNFVAKNSVRTVKLG